MFFKKIILCFSLILSSHYSTGQATEKREADQDQSPPVQPALDYDAEMKDFFGEELGSRIFSLVKDQTDPVYEKSLKSLVQEENKMHFKGGADGFLLKKIKRLFSEGSDYGKGSPDNLLKIFLFSSNAQTHLYSLLWSYLWYPIDPQWKSAPLDVLEALFQDIPYVLRPDPRDSKFSLALMKLPGDAPFKERLASFINLLDAATDGEAMKEHIYRKDVITSLVTIAEKGQDLEHISEFLTIVTRNLNLYCEVETSLNQQQELICAFAKAYLAPQISRQNQQEFMDVFCKFKSQLNPMRWSGSTQVEIVEALSGLGSLQIEEVSERISKEIECNQYIESTIVIEEYIEELKEAKLFGVDRRLTSPAYALAREDSQAGPADTREASPPYSAESHAAGTERESSLRRIADIGGSIYQYLPYEERESFIARLSSLYSTMYFTEKRKAELDRKALEISLMLIGGIWNNVYQYLPCEEQHSFISSLIFLHSIGAGGAERESRPDCYRPIPQSEIDDFARKFNIK